MRELLEQWRASFLISFDALRKRDANLSLPLATREVGGTSIVCIPASSSDSSDDGRDVRATVEVVSWKDPASKHGYIVDLDAEWLLIPVVHVGPKRFATDFSMAEVLVCQTGVTWTRAKRRGTFAERNELPSH